MEETTEIQTFDGFGLRPELLKAIRKFFDWAFKNGQKTAEELDYVALPAVLVKQIDAALRASLKDSAGNPVVK